MARRTASPLSSPLSSALALAAIAASAVLVAPPASAAPPVREDIHEEFGNELTDYCDVPGLTVTNAGTFDSRLQRRTTRGVDYFLEHITVRNVLTGVASGRSVTIETAYIAKDLKVVLAGSRTTVTSLLTGPSTVYGPDGKAIARDPGQLRLQLVFDDQGTPDPADDTEEITVLKESTGRSDDYCAAIVTALG